MTTVCPLCRGELLSRGVDADFGLTRCQSCNVRFELSSLARVDGHPEEAAPIPRDPPATPFLARRDESPGRLRLSTRFMSGRFAFLALFAVIWNGILWLGLGANPDLILEAPFVLIHVAVGIGTAYMALAGLFNSRSIELTRGRLHVACGPLPWPGNLTISTADLTQLFCITQVHTDSYGGETYTYEVHALLNDHARRKLLGGIATLPQALWFEQEVERFLGIRDEPVTGESRTRYLAPGSQVPPR